MAELDTEVKGDPDSLTVTARWMRERCVDLEDIARAFVAARGESESGWQGAAGEHFRDLVTQGDKLANAQTALITTMLTQLETHRDDLRTVRTQMRRALDVALEGGLTIKGHKIQEPGPAPAEPGELGQNPSPQDKAKHADATQAMAAYVKKVKAYKEASEIVEAARKKETSSQSMVIQLLSGTFDPAKFTLTLGDMTTGAAAAIAARTSAWRTVSANVKSPTLASKMAANPNLSAAGRLQAAKIAAERSMEAKFAANMAQATRAARFIDKYVPPKVQKALDGKLLPENVKPPSNIFAQGATKVLGKLPAVGLVFTGAGVGVDVMTGKDPTQAVVSNGSGFVVGGLVGTCIGGPPGAIAGGVVGIGVGFAVDAVWDAFD